MSLAQWLFLAKTNPGVWIIIFVPILIAIVAASRRKKAGP
jgi:hypothetical protein